MWIAIAAAWAAIPDHSAPSAGRSVFEVELPEFGRYAFEAHSTIGTTLQLVDRMQGPGPIFGTAGETDGRIDTFLDRGQIRVLTHGPSDGRGEVRVSITPFERVGPALQLRHNEPVLTELEDRQERAWWVEADGVVPFEAVGRSLGDLRLWRDGTWLVDATPRCTTVDPVEGQPMRRCTLTADLPAGLYQIVAYGGPPQPWANEASDAMLSLRWGAPVLPEAGRRYGRIGPTGMDFFQAPSTTTIAHLTLSEIAPVDLELRTHSLASLFDPIHPEAQIRDESRTPEATASATGSGPKTVVIRGTPGQRYTLDWFPGAPEFSRVHGQGEVLLTALSTARTADDLQPTGLLFQEREEAGGRDEWVQTLGISLDAGVRFRQRFNLLGRAQIFVQLDEDADVSFKVTEGSATLLFERVFTTRPRDWVAQKGRPQEWSDHHKAGAYRLTIEPHKPGIIRLEGQRNSWSDQASATVNGLKDLPLRPGFTTRVNLETANPMEFKLLNPPGIYAGYTVRELPLDPSTPVPIPLAPGETFALPVAVDTPTELRATGPDGEPLPLGGLGVPSSSLSLPAGTFAVQVINPTDEPLIAVLGAVVPPTPLAPLPTERLDALRHFPRLTDAEPLHTRLDRHEMATAQLEVASDGLYQLESTGLLATRGTLRSRVVTDLGTGSQNGVGRNFRVARYLRSGAYQITVQTEEQTRGHLGVELSPVKIHDGGLLEDGQLARATVPAFEGIAYRFEVAEPGTYTLRSVGQAQRFRCRLEDAQGWPVTRPDGPCDQSVDLQPGEYELRSLPATVDTRRLTSVTRQRAAQERSGHGPFALQLGQTAHHIWAEPTGDGERPSDIWRFVLPAPAEVTVDPGEEMAGTLILDGETLTRLSPARPWTGTLEPGEYSLALRAARRGTGIEYAVRVSTEQLTVGQERNIRLPASIPLRVGAPGLVTVYSTGKADVRARLLGPDGEVLAANDDRPDDWNFRFSRWMQPGEWTLEVQGDSGARSTVVHIEQPREEPGPRLAPKRKPHHLETSAQTRAYPLKIGPTKQAIVAIAHASQNIGIALEQLTPDGWQSLGTAVGTDPTLLGRRTPGHDARLRVWSLDGRSGPVELELSASNPRSVVSGSSTTPGLYRVVGDRTGLQICPELGQPCRPAGPVIAVSKRTVLFGRDVQLRRADLSGDPVPVALSPRHTVIDTGLDGLVAAQIRSASADAALSLGEDGATALGQNGAMALGKSTLEVWGSGVGRVRAVALKQQREPWGREEPWSGEIPPRTALVLPIGSKLRSYALTLERGLLARSGAQAVWADTDALEATLLGADTLVLANPTERPAMARVAPPTEAPAPLVSGQPHEQHAATAGVQLLDIAAADGTLHAAGAEIAYLGADGQVARGSAVEIGSGGQATIHHGVGWHAVWSDSGGPGPWPATDAERLAIEPGVTHIEAEAPFAVRVGIDGQERVEWRPSGGSVDALTCRGGALWVRPLGAESLETTVSTEAVESLEDGVGPEVLLGPGSAAWFRFELDHDGPIGFGVRASADRVRATLVSPDGAELAHGVVGRAELKAGTWYLRLSQPSDAPPVRARPAVAGLHPPDSGPPDEVIRTYLSTAGGDR